jgi:hypothetical protein
MDSNELREHLSKTLKGIQDGTVNIETAKAIGDIAQVAINLAKVEVDFVRANGGGRSEFFESSNVKQVTQTANGSITQIGNVTRHTLR